MSSRWTDAFLDAKRRIGDPPADDVVAKLFAGGDVDAVSALMRTLVRNDQLPPEDLPPVVRDYLDESLSLPAWADRDLIRRGEACFQRWGPQMSMALLCASLPSSYAARQGVQVLRLTARLATDTKRRIVETSQFLMDVMAPGGLLESGEGIRVTQKVRLMHAAVRHLIREAAQREPGLWNDDWGVPINQEDLAGTLMAFTRVVIDALRRLEIPLEHDEAEAYLHAWNVIGHLLGISADLLPADVAEAGDLVSAIQRRQFAASPAGEEMTSALVEMMEGLSPAPIFRGVPAAMIRHLVGDRTADLIGVHRPGRSRWIPLAALRLLRLIDREEVRHRKMVTLSEPFSRTLLQNSPLVQRGRYRAPFQIPTALRERWQIGEPEAVTAMKERYEAVAGNAGHRPEPLPAKPWIMAQHWEHLLFAHWPVPAETLRPVVPARLEVETFDGSAWLSVVAMRLRNAHFRGLPPFPHLRFAQELNLSDFPELNFRTYVTLGGKPGVLFFSLDTTSPIIVWLSRHLFHLPYFHADLKMAAAQEPIAFRSHRVQRGAPPADFAARYRPVGDLLSLEPGSLDHFLTDRYVMYTAGADGSLYRGEVYHPPWLVRAAEAEFEVNAVASSVGLSLPNVAPLLRYARATDSLMWAVEHVH